MAESVTELCALAITAPRDGMSMRQTLDSALALLKSAFIPTEGSAEVRATGQDMATILLRSEHDRTRALKLLLNNGFKAKVGAAGF